MTSDKTTSQTLAPSPDRPLHVTVLGGTGFTGEALVRAAVDRGHHVTAISRNTPTGLPAGATHRVGSVLDAEVLETAVTGADVVLSALSPRGELFDQLARVNARLVDLAATMGVRVGVVGGFSSLRPAPGAPRMAEGDDLPPEFAAEGKQMLAVLIALEQTPAEADWFFVSPPMGYGAHNPVEPHRTWQIGGDVANFDPARTDLSAADFAAAIIDEVEHPTQHRTAFSVTP